MELGLHHARTRSRGARRTPSRRFDTFMLVVGFIQPLALVPQIEKIYVSHSTAGVSFSTWGLFTAFNALWGAYGFSHRDAALTIAYVLITILDGVIAVGALIY